MLSRPIEVDSSGSESEIEVQHQAQWFQSTLGPRSRGEKGVECLQFEISRNIIKWQGFC